MCITLNKKALLSRQLPLASLITEGMSDRKDNDRDRNITRSIASLNNVDKSTHIDIYLIVYTFLSCLPLINCLN